MKSCVRLYNCMYSTRVFITAWPSVHWWPFIRSFVY